MEDNWKPIGNIIAEILEKLTPTTKQQTRRNDMKELTELLACAWMECDPNRMPAEPYAIDGRNGKPEWMWFIPRAEAFNEYLFKNGYKIVPIEAKND